MGLLLLLVTSCLAPEEAPLTKAPAPVTSVKELVRRLAPGLSDSELAAVPERVIPVPSHGVAPAAPPPFIAMPASSDDAVRARDCLTAAVYYEARSESVDGQRAVAQVVLNRVRDRAFPQSVCGVVYQGVGGGKGCQFSFACDGSTYRPREPGAWERAEQIAVAALNGGVMAAVGNATFYHANYVLPWWASSLTRLGAIGSHIFYRWPGAIERALGGGVRYAGVEPAIGAASGGAPVLRATADFGVNVFRGTVTVHRGGASGISGESDAPAVAPRAAAYGRVRIHRGEDAPVIAEEVVGT